MTYRAGDVVLGVIILVVFFGLVYVIMYYPIFVLPKEMNNICREQFNYDGYAGSFGGNRNECYHDLGNGTIELTTMKNIDGKWYLDGSSFYRSK